MLDRLIARWQGIALSLIGIVATVWLALTGRLGLYIHPRYFEFTVIMAVVAAVLIVAAFAFAPAPMPRHGHEHGHGQGEYGDDQEHDHAHDAEPRRGPTRTALSVLVVVAAAGALLVLPPSTLTSATAAQRSINNSGSALAQDTPELVGGDTSQFTVKDWALLLRQNPGADYFADRRIEVTGIVTASPDDPENVFYVTRFVVTCCAVDAQPVGVPVHLPGWAEQFEPDQWVTATGVFEPNADSPSDEPLLLTPADVAVTGQPDEPYVF